ncbi:response regulator [Flavobacterium sp. '19STA2R22 D10 B1']|uniref:response regulator n=1 Tax=Flavobacterium aerium TaxID=3037261 RepID=UPI00278C61FA|nr:response regulator [Flavobacterium sp. '19STA2R22 D10 B1']
MHQKPLNVVLADDDVEDRLIFADAIEEIKIKTVFTALNDGIQLMEYLQNEETIIPDIIFLDLNMPCKSGLDCLREIRNDKRLKNISIAIYSTSSSDEDIENTFVEGANVYIKKPTDFSALKKVMSEVLQINWQYQTSGLNKETFLLSI